MHESTLKSHFILTISQQQLQLFIKFSKFFRRATVDICTCKGNFENSYFLQRAATSNIYILNFLSGYCSFWKQLVKNIYLKHQIFVKTTYFFQRTTCQFLKVVCHFIWTKEQRPGIKFNRTGFFWMISLSHPFFHEK